MIFREENNKIIDAEIGIASEVLSKVSNMTDNIDFKITSIKKKSLGESILNNFYINYLGYLKQKNPNIKIDGYIVPKPGTFLSLIDYNKVSGDFLTYDMPILSKETRDDFANKVKNVIDKANNVNNIINNIIAKINNVLPTLNLAKPVFDYFLIEEFEVFTTYKMLKDAGYLTPFKSTTDINKDHMADLIGVLKTNVQTMSKITFDLELNNFIQDDVKNLADKDDFILKTGDLILPSENAVTLADNDLFIKILDVEQYEESFNSYIVILAYLLDLLEKAKKEYDLGTINLIEYNINKVVNLLTNAYKYISTNIDLGIVPFNIAKDEEGNFVIKVYAENFSKLQENNIKLETLLGFVVYKVEKNVPATICTLNKLQINTDTYKAYFDAFRSNLILTNKNNIKNKLINVYVLTISDYLDSLNKETSLEKIKNILKSMGISEIQDIKNTTRFLVVNVILNDINLLIFFTGMQEANDLLPADISIESIAGYAAFKFLLYYLAEQTEIK